MVARVSKFTFLFLIVAFFHASSYGQDTLVFGSAAIKKEWTISRNGYYLHSIPLKSTSVNTLLENIMNSIPGKTSKIKGDTTLIPNQVLISNCRIFNLKTYYTSLYFPANSTSAFKTNNSFTLDSCILYGEPDISGISVQKDHLFALNHDSFGNLMIESSSGWISLFENDITGKITAENDNILQFDLSQSEYHKTDTAIVEIKSSKIGKLLMTGNNMKNLRVELSNDSLFKDFELNPIIKNGAKPDSGGVALLIFKDCYINSSFTVGEPDKRISVRFINCSFGKDLDIKNLLVNDILFDNCTKFADQIDLNRINANQLGISFVNTELKNFRFNYLGKFKLFFPKGSKEEYKTSTFENLLAKFKVEGKLDSYKNIDIEYTQFQDAGNGILGTIKDALSRVWWYYSYRKYYILYWTAGLLLIFYIFNIRYWSALQSVYPMSDDAKKTRKKTEVSEEKTQKVSLTTIFIFTAFIFFSLRIDFDKLKYTDTRILWYFFSQYIIGLVCVFFIVNAILKI